METEDPKARRKTSLPEGMALHRAIYAELTRELQEGVYGPGERLPSEAALCKRFGTSRITVAKAIQSLQREGLVTRRAGSGTYVQRLKQNEGYQFGLLLPQLGSTEIFEPICQGMMRSPLAESHALLWGHAAGGTEANDEERSAEQLCRQFIDGNVAGVFFAPLEHTPNAQGANHRVVAALRAARIPAVLLDRDYEVYPRRSKLDLVGIDNYRAAFVVTQHLLANGAQRLKFVARKVSASTVLERMAGFQFALYQAGLERGGVHLGQPEEEPWMNQLLEDNPDGVVCGNDLTAARLMRSLLNRGVRIPEDIRIVSFDDVRYSNFLPVPLTTIRQDCMEIGRQALVLMLARVREPELPAAEVRVPFELVVRSSCGAHTQVSETTKQGGMQESTSGGSCEHFAK